MKKIAVASIITVFCAFTCALVAGDVSAQKGWEKTVTLPSGEKVLDMRGEWDVVYELYGSMAFYGSSQDILLITQEGNTFSAVKQIGTKWTPKGTESLKGELDKDGFKAVQSYKLKRDGTRGWVPCTCEFISEDGNTVVIDDGEYQKQTLTRR